MNDITIKELNEDYEMAWHFLRRKDASISKPSPLYDASDVLKIAVAEIDRLNKIIKEKS